MRSPPLPPSAGAVVSGAVVSGAAVVSPPSAAVVSVVSGAVVSAGAAVVSALGAVVAAVVVSVPESSLRPQAVTRIVSAPRHANQGKPWVVLGQSGGRGTDHEAQNQSDAASQSLRHVLA